MVDGGKLNNETVRVREVDSIRTPRTPWSKTLLLQFFDYRVNIEFLDCYAVMIQTRILVLEKRQEILPNSEEAIALRLAEYG